MITLNAVQLDALLAHLTPEVLEVIHRMQPVALRDQIAAASADTIAMIKQAMEKTGGTAHKLDHGAIPEWIRLGLLDTLVRWDAGTGSTCIHMPGADRPQPVWSCAWKPGLVVCSMCSPLLKAVGAMDQTCDRCGHVCDGIDAGDPIHLLRAVLGPLTYSAGACTDCCGKGVTKTPGDRR